MQLTNRSKIASNKKLNWIEKLYLPAIFQGMFITIRHLFKKRQRLDILKNIAISLLFIGACMY